MILGIDASTHFDEVKYNAKYYLDGKEVDPLKAFIQQNVEYFRIRVWNNPRTIDGKPYEGGNNDLDAFIKLGKLVKTYGYKIVLDIHYSDFWADPVKQFIPKEWEGCSYEELLKHVYDYTVLCLTKAKEADLPLEYIQIGNEITNGILWPVGKLDDSKSPRGNFDKLAEILKSGLKAVKDTWPSLKTIIHLERSFDMHIYDEYFTNIIALGVDFDIIGMSYYPTWHGTFDALFPNVEMCQKKFKKPVAIMEVSYPFTLEDYMEKDDANGHLVVCKDNYPTIKNNMSYPPTLEGQAEFIRDFIKECEKRDILGIFYWEPLWLPHGEDICWASKEGLAYIHEEIKTTRNEWSNQCLFDYKGNALPGFKAFKL